LKTVVIFDFDGTIADSVDLFVDAINKLSGKFKYKKIKPDEVKILQGKSTRQCIKYLQISFLKIPFMVKQLRREMKKGIAQTKPTVKIRDTLSELKKNECEIGILTSNTEQNVKEFLMNNNLDMFDFLYSGSSAFGKGRVLRAIIKKNKFVKNKIFYVGDEIRDIDAARKTKVKMIAVSWGYNTIESLKKEKPDYIANTPKDIQDIVLGK